MADNRRARAAALLAVAAPIAAAFALGGLSVASGATAGVRTPVHAAPARPDNGDPCHFDVAALHAAPAALALKWPVCAGD
jgi:hypothetical protein